MLTTDCTDGHGQRQYSLAESATDGCQTFLADGFPQLQINVPPEKTKEMDLFIVTVAYDNRQERDCGFVPPPAIRQT